MNIAFYTQQEITPYTGGIGRVTNILTDYFRHKYKWKVFSLFADTVPASFTKAEVDGFCQGRLHDRYGLRSGIKGNVRRAARFIKDNKIDVVIVQTSMDVPKRLRIALRQIGYDPVIITCLHFAPGMDIFRNKLSDIKNVSVLSAKGLKIVLKSVFSVIYNPVITHLTKQCYRRAYEYSDIVCLLSESYKEQFCRFAGINEQQKLMAMPNPLSFQSDFQEQELENKKAVALVVGRMSECQKRISRILSVWNEFESRYPDSDWRLKIVGNGESLADYKNLAQRLGLSRCDFFGSQDPKPYYKESKIFLMTSSFEGFPMTLIEAQQFGCVPIAMDAFTSLHEIITDGRNGIIVENNNENRFLDALSKLSSDQDLWRNMAVNALSDCQRFSQENVCAEWKKIIEQIAK